MSLSRSFDLFTYRLNLRLRRILVTIHELKNIKKKRALWNSVSLTTEQKKEISEFFRDSIGSNFSTKWHRLYQSYTGIYRVNYFPEILFSTKLEPKLNNYHEAELLGDKNLLPVLFGSIEGLHIPRTFASCVRGVCNIGGGVCNPKEVTSQLFDIGKCVVKKTRDTSSGRDVQICDFVDGIDVVSGKTIAEIIKQFGDNWTVQELIEQSKALQVINPTSVNTFRVITYFCKENLFVCPVAFRMGRTNANRDNIHYGGLVIGVNSDGTLKECAFSEYGDRFYEHPDSHCVFNGYRIIDYDDGMQTITDMAKCLHSNVPHLGIISWDLTIDSQDKITIIEMNTIGQSAWFCQMVNGESLFRENTGDMLRLIK